MLYKICFVLHCFVLRYVHRIRSFVFLFLIEFVLPVFVLLASNEVPHFHNSTKQVLCFLFVLDNKVLHFSQLSMLAANKLR